MLLSKFTRLCLVAALGSLLGTSARAELVVNAIEVGGDVVFSGGGTADLSALGFFQTAAGTPAVDPSLSVAVVGDAGDVDIYSGVFAPTNFGPGLLMFADSAMGDIFGVSLNFAHVLIVPTGYVSGTVLSGSATFQGETFASLGLTQGTYVWTWGAGSNADSFTLNIVGATAVPEPSSLALIGMGGLGLIGLARRRKRA